MVGTARFELATTCPPDKCATRLRYAPIDEKAYSIAFLIVSSIKFMHLFFILFVQPWNNRFLIGTACLYSAVQNI